MKLDAVEKLGLDTGFGPPRADLCQLIAHHLRLLRVVGALRRRTVVEPPAEDILSLTREFFGPSRIVGRRIRPEGDRGIADAQAVAAASTEQRVQRRAVAERSGRRGRRVVSLLLAVGFERLDVERNQRHLGGRGAVDALDLARGFALLIAASSRIDRVGDRDGLRRTVPCHVAWRWDQGVYSRGIALRICLTRAGYCSARA